MKMDEYKPKSEEQPPRHLYMRNTISLKGLEPGDYELTMILHDEIAKDAPARQVVKFQIVPPTTPGRRRRRRKAKTRSGMMTGGGSWMQCEVCIGSAGPGSSDSQAAGSSRPLGGFSSKGSWLLPPPNSSSPSRLAGPP